jgi:hypothetical protein
MNRKTLVVGITILLLSGLVSFAQYTGSDIERKKAENLYPEPGPGELMIIDQLKATNVQLQEQTRLLSEQNRILQDTLEQIKKQKGPEVPPARPQ